MTAVTTANFISAKVALAPGAGHLPPRRKKLRRAAWGAAGRAESRRWEKMVTVISESGYPLVTIINHHYYPLLSMINH